jgi:hypothetical protein
MKRDPRYRSLWANLATLSFAILGCGVLFADSPPGETRKVEGGPIAVKHVGGGRIRIESGKRKVKLDIRSDVSGCFTTRFDPTTDEKYPADVDLEVLDQGDKAPFKYLLLLISASPNCNIQGRCGAGGPESTLLWLKLGKNLAPVDRQAVLIEGCNGPSVAHRPERSEETSPGAYLEPIHAQDLPWAGERLEIELAGESGERAGKVIYDRSKPEEGLRQVPLPLPPGT